MARSVLSHPRRAVGRLRGRVQLATVVAVLLALLAAPVIATVPAFLDDVPVVSGDPAPRTVVAPATVRVTDEAATDQARADAYDAVEPVTSIDRDAQQAAVGRVRDLFTAARDAREQVAVTVEPSTSDRGEDRDAGEGEPGDGDGSDDAQDADDEPQVVFETPSADEQVDALTSRFAWLTAAAARELVGASNARLDVLEAELTATVRSAVLLPFTASDRDAAVARTIEEQTAVRPFRDDEVRYLVPAVVDGVVSATVTVDQDATELAQAAAQDAVEDIRVTFGVGQPVVTRGEQVTDAQVAALEQLGLVGTSPWTQLVRVVVVLATACVPCGLLLARRPGMDRRPWLLPTAAFWLVVFTAVLTATMVARTLSPATVWALPAGAVTLLAATMFGSRAGGLFAVPMAAVTLAVLPGRPDLAVAVLLGGVATALVADGFTSRRRIRGLSVLAALVYAAVATVASVTVTAPSPAPAVWVVFTTAAVSTLVVVLAGVALLPLLEARAGVVTTTGLLDLEDRNHPLLRRLQDEAPGTYNHSMLVSTLARRAAETIGANAPLVAVQALYHDIGKVCRPNFFVENQLGGLNPHDGIDPAESASIIHAHVSDGVTLARRSRLPDDVVDGIATHHGDSLVAFFFRQATAHARSVGEPDPDEATFRYPGRRPATKETAILMLADICESAARSASLDRRLQEHELEQLVESLVADKVTDGQLDDSPLTLADLAAVKRSLVTSLVGVYHPRVAYPDKPGERPTVGR